MGAFLPFVMCDKAMTLLAHELIAHVEDYQEGEVRVQSQHGTGQYGCNLYLQFQETFSSILSDGAHIAGRTPKNF